MTLRDKLTALIAWAGDAQTPAGHFMGGEGERRADMDLSSGRVHVRSVRDHARRGLMALDMGDPEMARGFYDQAHGLAAIVMARFPDAKRPPIYGRAGSDRNVVLAELVDAKRADTRATITDACLVVLAENPALARRFNSREPATLARAYRRGQKRT